MGRRSQGRVVVGKLKAGAQHSPLSGQNDVLMSRGIRLRCRDKLLRKKYHCGTVFHGSPWTAGCGPTSTSISSSGKASGRAASAKVLDQHVERPEGTSCVSTVLIVFCRAHAASRVDSGALLLMPTNMPGPAHALILNGRMSKSPGHAVSFHPAWVSANLMACSARSGSLPASKRFATTSDGSQIKVNWGHVQQKSGAIFWPKIQNI
jgi:hypothetical protein